MVTKIAGDTDTLALLGGGPAVTLDETEAARWPIVEQEEQAAVQEVLAAGQWSTSPVPRQLEAKVAAYHGVRYALSTNNSTAALHAAFFGLGIGPGDEVISPPATYGHGALPVTDNPPADRISLPNFPRPSRALLEQYVAAFRKVARNVAQLR